MPSEEEAKRKLEKEKTREGERMTSEEAREVLGDVRAYLASRASLENEMLAGHTFTDICNAINTLEQQPCGDCISREEVKDKLMELWTKYMPMELDMHLSFVLEKISELPSVTPKTRWIPCSERIPEVSDYYLIQHSRHICRDEMAVAYYSVEEAELDKNYTWEFKPFADCKEVIAWMPLPEPYKESEDKE